MSDALSSFSFGFYEDLVRDFSVWHNFLKPFLGLAEGLSKLIGLVK